MTRKSTFYGFIDRTGRSLVRFRDIYDIGELDGMEKETTRILEAMEAIQDVNKR